jgi:hypothetical protein
MDGAHTGVIAPLSAKHVVVQRVLTLCGLETWRWCLLHGLLRDVAGSLCDEEAVRVGNLNTPDTIEAVERVLGGNGLSRAHGLLGFLPELIQSPQPLCEERRWDLHRGGHRVQEVAPDEGARVEHPLALCPPVPARPVVWQNFLHGDVELPDAVHVVVIPKHSLTRGLDVVQRTKDGELVHVPQELGEPAANYVDLHGLRSGLGRVHLGDHLGWLAAEVEQQVGLAVKAGHERVRVGDVELPRAGYDYP